MGRPRKFDYQAAIESGLVAQPDGLTLDELLARCGLRVDRSTLFRHLALLIKEGRVERVGNARASYYRPLNAAQIDPAPVRPYPPTTVHPAPQAPELQQSNDPPAPSPDVVLPLREGGGAEPDGVPVVAPDYGAAVKKAVRTVVRDWKRSNPVNLRIYLSLLVPPEYLEQAAAAVEFELAGLREGNLAEFGLTPAEYAGYTAPADRAPNAERMPP